MDGTLGRVKQAIPPSARRFLRQTVKQTVRNGRLLSRRLRNDRLAVIIGSANRVGSTWLHQMIAQLGHFDEGYGLVTEGFRDSGCVLLDQPGFFAAAQAIPGYAIYKTHSYPPGRTIAPEVKIISIYRDPRDVITSNIFSLTHLRDWDIKLGDGDFRKMSEQERIKAFVRDADYCIAKLEQWYHDPHSFRVSYEALKQQPVATLRGVVDYLGLRANDARIRRVVELNAFERSSGRKPGEERRDSAQRKGISGDWRNYFDAECIAAFKTAQDGRWNRLLLEMGYEQTPDWV